MDSLPRSTNPKPLSPTPGARLLPSEFLERHQIVNLAAAMRTMGHCDVKTAVHYQHPELDIVRAALDYRPPASKVAAQQIGYDTFCDNLGKSLNTWQVGEDGFS